MSIFSKLDSKDNLSSSKEEYDTKVVEIDAIEGLHHEYYNDDLYRILAGSLKFNGGYGPTLAKTIYDTLVRHIMLKFKQIKEMNLAYHNLKHSVQDISEFVTQSVLFVHERLDKESKTKNLLVRDS